MTAPRAETENPDDRIRALQQRLAELRSGGSAILRTRLAHAYPYHITRVARGVFLVLTCVCGVLLVSALTMPLLLPDMALMVREVEEALPLPLPMLVLFLALLMAVSWVTAGQAALAIARDCPLLPWELEEQRKIENELSILTKSSTGSGFVADERGSSPAPLHMPQSRLGSSSSVARAFPSPVPTEGGTLRYDIKPSFPPPPGSASTGNSFPRETEPALYQRATPPSAPTRTPTPALSYRGPGGVTRSTPASSPPRSAGANKSTPTSDVGIVQYERRPHDSYTIGPNTMVNPTHDPPSGAASWKQPRFSQVDEPWLQDALSKAQALSSRYPVQAFLEYSVEPDLPFTLVLERATPAMAVRAMVDFVGFLASISTPRRARIELRSVVHLDRSFYRSVMSAMEPYFPDTVEVRQQGYRVEVTFLEPDRNWARYPILPIDE